MKNILNLDNKIYRAAFLFLIFSGGIINAAEISYSGGSNYSYIERTDLRRYDNGKYTGLISREVRSFISEVEHDESGSTYDGNFYVDESTRRANASVGQSINEAIDSKFKISSDGELIMQTDNGYPSFRSFPTYTEKKIEIGDKWEAKATRAVDPLYKGIVTHMPIYVQYEYLRDEVYAGEEVFVLSAKWATRYGAKFYLDFGGDKDLVEGFGKHSATLYVQKSTGQAIVVRDSVDEVFTYSDGNKIAFKGTISLFTKYPPTVDHEKINDLIEKIKEKNEIDVEVTKTDSGICLSLSDLRFEPDTCELLPGERERISQIAKVLLLAPESQFLIEGHTAYTGNEQDELALSKERAITVARELSLCGIDSSRFICKGSGSHKPVADNSTKEGMAKNRRVEITILE